MIANGSSCLHLDRVSYELTVLTQKNRAMFRNFHLAASRTGSRTLRGKVGYITRIANSIKVSLVDSSDGISFIPYGVRLSIQRTLYCEEKQKFLHTHMQERVWVGLHRTHAG
ncbi:hypothetical protein BGZ60DRAFT_237892 [Tricladium varicosporioides]|nr:hypothetical protein BGZ60DRAFT_237892 [Hymenoscyphus varicosporioides]